MKAVGKERMSLKGELKATDAKAALLAWNKRLDLPAKTFLLKLAAGRRYRISQESDEFDSVLVVHDEKGRQVAWDDDSGGGLNASLDLETLVERTFKVSWRKRSRKGEGEIHAHRQGTRAPFQPSSTCRTN